MRFRRLLSRLKLRSVPTNLALGRPATQSSVSQWSRFPTTEADARGANNGKIDGVFGFHTDKESCPWWQVDLQALCVLRAVRLFNRQQYAYRLRHFSILASPDGNSWTVLDRRNIDSDFGADNLLPYTVALPPDTVARFLRVRLDGTGYLHFCECEVVGTTADATETAAFQRSEQARQALAGGGRRGHVATIGDIRVFVDTEKYSALIIDTLTAGQYEAPERMLVNELLEAHDRVLEIGTAIGVVAMTAAKIVGAANVLTYEANPRIAADARWNFALNGLAEIQSRVGVLCNRSRIGGAPREMDFAISREFWASRLQVTPGRDDIVETVSVPTVCLEDQIESHRATVLICDIEGGEIELLSGADLTGIRLIIMEVHKWAVGAPLTDALMRSLIVGGFNIDLFFTGHDMVVLSR